MDLASTQYGFWRVAEKVRRRALRLAGRPDNSPWVLEPRRQRRTAPADFMFALDYLSPNSRLLRMFHEAMGAYGLSVLLVNSSNVQKVAEEIEQGWQRPAVYLDLSSRPGDEFEQLLFKTAAKGTHTIRKPEHDQWCYKARSQGQLEKAGLPVPPTIVIPASEADRELTPQERALVGDSAVIKPSFGEACKGVVVGVEPTRQNISKARDYHRDWDWLVQRKIDWTTFGDRQAYVRAYHVCGNFTLLWWCKDRGKDGYDLLTWDDLQKHDLMPALRIVQKLADLTGMDYFSSEIAITDAPHEKERFVLIDYVNDQCDMDPAGHPEFSPPESFCRWVCERLAEFVWRKKAGLGDSSHRGLYLPS